MTTPRSFRDFRKSKGLTQDEVAAQAGVSQSEISQGERFGFHETVADKLAAHFKIPRKLLPLRPQPVAQPKARASGA